MTKMKNLSELEKIIDKDSIDKCFSEYILTIIGKAHRLDDLENGKAVMADEELEEFIKNLKKNKKFNETKATLIALGYDKKWVASLDIGGEKN